MDEAEEEARWESEAAMTIDQLFDEGRVRPDNGLGTIDERDLPHLNNTDSLGSAQRNDNATVDAGEAKRRRIAITCLIPSNGSTVFTSGRHMAPFFLYETLRHRHDVLMVDLSVNFNTSTPGGEDVPLVSFAAARQLKPDIWIQASGRLLQNELDAIQRDGGVVAAYLNENVLRRFTDHSVFPNDTASDPHFQAQGFHAVILPEHHYDTSAAFVEVLYTAKVVEAPFVWHPRFFNHFAKLQLDRKFYSHRPGSRHVGVLEPNFHIDRQLGVPAVALEHLYRRDPRAFDTAYITNSDHFKFGEFWALRRKGLSFSYLGNKLQYTGRFRTPYALSAKLDLVLAHQWDNALNFMYMDVLHAGYPLVHNSPYLSDCGGYYRDSDAFTAADEVDRLFNTYTGTRREHKQSARCVWRYHAYNPRIQRGWDRVVEELMETPLTLERKAQLDGTTTAPAKEASPVGPYDATNGLAHFEDRPPLRRPVKRYRIALTISVAKGDLKTGSAFVNGMRQTALFLHQLLTQESRHEVVFVNLNQGTRADIPADWAFEPSFLFVNFDTALKLGLHVWIEVGIQLSQHQLNQVQAKGEKVVTYRGGNDYFMAVERFVFNSSAPLPMFTTQGYDAVWTLPNFYDQSAAFLEATFNTNLVRPAPYVWHPRLWDNLATQLARRKYYAPRHNRSVIGVFESNMHLVKQAVIPLVAAELLHRRNASAFEKIVVGCSDRLLKSQEFNDLVIRGLDLYKAKRVEFSNRYRLPWYLSDNIDYVLSYQWDNELNYLHLDVLHAGYPLIHNSPYFKDCGYYYPEGEGHIAADQLDRAIKTHSGNMDAYAASAKQCLWQFHTANEDNVLGWDRLLDEVVNTPRAEHRQKELDTWVAAEEHKRGPPASPMETHLERLRQRDEAALGEAWSAPPPRKLRVGMTTSLPPEGRAVFANGAQQTASYIWEALSYKGRHEAHLINLDLGNLSSASSDWRYKEENVSLLTFNEALDRNFDVILETGMQLSEVQLALLQVKGVKVVSYRPGNDYFMVTESFLYGLDRAGVLGLHGFDQVWTLPAFMRASSTLKVIFRDVPIVSMPFLWSARFIDHHAKGNKHRRFYTNVGPAKRIASFESNLHMVKTSFIPMMAVELLYRRRPDLVKKAYFGNTQALSNHTHFKQLESAAMSVVTAGRAEHVGRFRLPWFLSDRGDIVLSHQWGNPMNYLYLDAMWLGYPVVHNSPYLKDCGYYYEHDDAYMAADMLEKAILEFDKNMEAQYAQMAECIWRHWTTNPYNILEWEEKLFAVLEMPRRASRLNELRETMLKLHNKTGTGAPDISVEPTAATELPVATANSRPAAPARDAVQTRANEEYQDAGPPAEDRATSGQAEKAPRDAEVDEITMEMAKPTEVERALPIASEMPQAQRPIAKQADRREQSEAQPVQMGTATAQAASPIVAKEDASKMLTDLIDSLVADL